MVSQFAKAKITEQQNSNADGAPTTTSETVGAGVTVGGAGATDGAEVVSAQEPTTGAGSTSDELASSTLRRSLRLHVQQATADALRDRGPAQAVATVYNVGTQPSASAASASTSSNGRSRFILTPFGYRRSRAISSGDPVNVQSRPPAGRSADVASRLGRGSSRKRTKSDLRARGSLSRKPTATSGVRASTLKQQKKRQIAHRRLERDRTTQASALRRPAAQLHVYEAHARLRRAEFRVGRLRRELLTAETALNDIDFEVTGNEVQRAADRVAEGRRIAEDAYRAVQHQLGSDAPTLPDCLADDDTEEDDDTVEDDEDEDSSSMACNYDSTSDSDYDDRMDLDAVVPPIHVDQE